jgi:GntR family transcriptional repressor for pyruvate dehydrogenase complex
MLKRRIASGKLTPGGRLPPERELAGQLGVSRPVVREAVHRLIAQGLLESRQGSGTTVRRVTSQALVDPLNWLVESKAATIDNLHEVRSILEVEIVHLAALRATDREIGDLRELVAEMCSQRADLGEFARLDGVFHQRLAEITHNPLLSLMVDSVRDLIQQIRLQVQVCAETRDALIDEHGRIVAAIAARDGAGAGQVMTQHLEPARAIQEACLSPSESPG